MMDTQEAVTIDIAAQEGATPPRPLPSSEMTALSMALDEERAIHRQYRREAREAVVALRSYAAHLEDRITVIGNLAKAGDHHALLDMIAETKAVIAERGFGRKKIEA